MKTLDIVATGHLSIDHIRTPGTGVYREALGGSSAYVSFSARKLGAQAGVISEIGADFPDTCMKTLRQEGIDLFGLKEVKDAATTSFTLTYSNEKRKLTLKSRAPLIGLEDVALDFSSRIIHVAPIAGEISSEVVRTLRAKTDMLSLDPQGFLRQFDAEGRTRLKKWKADGVLEQVDVYKSSLREAEAVTGKRNAKTAMETLENIGIKTVIITLGEEGALLRFDKTSHRIPAFSPGKLVDPTGAGDVFAGAFLAECLHKKDLLWCACVGSAAASFKVETFGPVLGATKLAIYRRAEVLFEMVYAGRDAQRVKGALSERE